jgi:hypothetical protein
MTKEKLDQCSVKELFEILPKEVDWRWLMIVFDDEKNYWWIIRYVFWNERTITEYYLEQHDKDISTALKKMILFLSNNWYKNDECEWG